jgi:hypothetical protein
VLDLRRGEVASISNRMSSFFDVELKAPEMKRNAALDNKRN